MRPIVAMCCFCEKVRDDRGTEPGGVLWQDFTIYMSIHMLKPEEVMFSHGYCPGCLSVCKDSLMQPKEAGHGPGMEKGA
jgi:hypothetical protein